MQGYIKTFKFGPIEAEQLVKLDEVRATGSVRLQVACDKAIKVIVREAVGESVLEDIEIGDGFAWDGFESPVAAIEAWVNASIHTLVEWESDDLGTDVRVFHGDKWTQTDAFVNDRRERIAREEGQVGDWRVIELGQFGRIALIAVPVKV